MNQIKKATLLCIGVLTALSSLAVPQECNALMEKVEKRLQSKGIQYYTLEWIDASTHSSMRVVGRCRKGNVKLVYSQQHKKNNTSVTEKPTQPSPAPVLTANTSVTLQLVTLPSTEPTDNVQLLIQSLYSNTGDFAHRIQELIDRTDTTLPMIKAYYAAANDATFRFNVILLLNQKIKVNSLGSLDMEATEQCLLDALKDNSPLVRGEALWGLGQTRNKKWAPAVNALLSDPDAAVRSEAQITSSLLRD
jgi:hypothetical protein